MPERAVGHSVASVVARLKNEGRALGLGAGQLRVMPLQMAYAHQGFLARLDASPHAERFLVKGGASLFARHRALGRPTRDLDLASAGPPPHIAEVGRWIAEICAQPVGDLLTFPAEELRIRAVTPDSAAHPVLAVSLTAHLGASRQPVDLDLSFGSVVHPGACVLDYPRLVIPQAVRMRAYPLEQIVAEKFAAMVELGVVNTRMKDFHDLWQIAGHDPPNPVPAQSARGMRAVDLGEAMRRSFEVRRTPLGELEQVLGEPFARDAGLLAAWARYRGKASWAALPDFAEVMGVIRACRCRRACPARAAARRLGPPCVEQRSLDVEAIARGGHAGPRLRGGRDAAGGSRSQWWVKGPRWVGQLLQVDGVEGQAAARSVVRAPAHAGCGARDRGRAPWAETWPCGEAAATMKERKKTADGWGQDAAHRPTARRLERTPGYR